MKHDSNVAREDRATRIGVLSDTHGQVTATALGVLEEVSMIIHAGDLDTPEVLDHLRRIGPTVAVRGNMDRGPWTEHLPVAETIDVGDLRIHIRHILTDIDLDPAAADIHLVVSGHTHLFEETRKNGVLYLNPGSARLPRAGGPASMAVVTVQGNRAQIQRVDL